MNLKRIFGAVLTILGIIGLLMGAFAFMSGGASFAGMALNKTTALVPAILGIIFLFSGIGLLKTTQDRS